MHPLTIFLIVSFGVAIGYLLASLRQPPPIEWPDTVVLQVNNESDLEVSVNVFRLEEHEATAETGPVGLVLNITRKEYEP